MNWFFISTNKSSACKIYCWMQTEFSIFYFIDASLLPSVCSLFVRPSVCFFIVLSWTSSFRRSLYHFFLQLTRRLIHFSVSLFLHRFLPPLMHPCIRPFPFPSLRPAVPPSFIPSCSSTPSVLSCFCNSSSLARGGPKNFPKGGSQSYLGGYSPGTNSVEGAPSTEFAHPFSKGPFTRHDCRIPSFILGYVILSQRHDSDFHCPLMKQYVRKTPFS